MSRSTSVMGLSAEATEWLQLHAERQETKVCPTCKHTTGGGYLCEVYDDETGRKAGMFDDGPQLFQYKTEFGNIKEVIQCTPWNSGPCIFLCLEDENGGRIGEWTEEQIDDAGG